MVNYGGDEVSAIVIDIGSSSVRVGHAGDDTPKAIIPSSYGFIPALQGTEDITMDGTTTNGAQKSAQFFVGQSGPSLWRNGMEVANPLTDGLITDFDPIQKLIDHAITDVMRCNASEHPILCTEPAWNTPANRERMAEIMFEEFQVPAFYIANTGVLNSFAAGKGSALVIDIGKDMASVTPVVDGFVLRKGLTYGPLPKLVHANARHILSHPLQHRPMGISLLPHQLIASKVPVETHGEPRYTERVDRMQGTTKSWLNDAEGHEVEEWIQSVVQVLEQGWNDMNVASRPPRQYEFPTGYNTYFGIERFQIGETFFTHSPQLVASNSALPRTIPGLITDSLRTCDPELRQVLMGNVVLTGGGSLLQGLSERLYGEIRQPWPHAKIHAPGNPVERRFGGWLGGSILASLGTFHQLWISKEEWQEHGKAIVGQRCK